MDQAHHLPAGAGRARGIMARLPRWCLLLGLFLMILGAKLWLIDRFGNSTPYGDEWDSEASIIQSYVEGTLTPPRFFALHNEHRTLFSRLLCLAVFAANKQWDPFILMIAQAPLHALAIVAFVAGAGHFMNGGRRAALAGFAALVAVLPFGWDNTLWGFQSAFYFMMLFGIGAIWLCWRHEAGTLRWWLGALLALASLFTLAGGVFSVMAVTVFLAGRLALDRSCRRWRSVSGAALLAGIVALGILLTPGPPPHYTGGAGSMKAFLFALSGILSWPCASHAAFLIIQAPLVALALLTLLRRVPFKDGRWFVIIAGASYWIQAIITAYRRCKDWNALRYYDCWVMLLLIGCAALCFLLADLAGRARLAGLLVYPLAAIWLFTCLWGVAERMINVVPGQLMERRAERLEMENNVRQYVHTGDSTWLNGKIPFPSARAARLADVCKALRAFLPPNLIDAGAPLAPALQKIGAEGFVTGGAPGTVPALDRPFVGSYSSANRKARSRITYQFSLPPGTRQVNLLVAGYPNADGISLKVDQRHRESSRIAPLDPGENWQTIFIRVNPKIPFFRINATDESERSWVAFSMPVVCNGQPLGRAMRTLADHFLPALVAGAVLLLIGAMAGIAERSSTTDLAESCLAANSPVKLIDTPPAGH